MLLHLVGAPSGRSMKLKLARAFALAREPWDGRARVRAFELYASCSSHCAPVMLARAGGARSLRSPSEGHRAAAALVARTEHWGRGTHVVS